MPDQSSATDLLPNPHPGEILLKDFLMPLGLSERSLAYAIQMPLRIMNEILRGERDVVAETDRRLARFLGMSDGFFVGLQRDYNLMQNQRNTNYDL